MTTLLDHRRELIAQLELEAAAGWPRPYWEVDRRPMRPLARVVVYLDDLCDAIDGRARTPLGGRMTMPDLRDRRPSPPDALTVHGTDTAEAAAELRHEYGLSDRDIADELGVAAAEVDGLVADWEKGLVLT